MGISRAARKSATMIARLVAAAFGFAMFCYAAAFVLSILAIVMTVYALFCVTRALWRAYLVARGERHRRRAELVARAEIQHRWYLAGDPRGIYGRYPPAIELRR